MGCSKKYVGWHGGGDYFGVFFMAMVQNGGVDSQLLQGIFMQRLIKFGSAVVGEFGCVGQLNDGCGWP